MRVAVLTVSLLPIASAIAQSPTFAPPVRLKAGDSFLGHKDPDGRERLYPSPVYHDLDGDGLADIVVGDLRGHLTVARRVAGSAPAFAKEEKVLGADGKILDLGNW
jgi:hypothetical protein